MCVDKDWVPVCNAELGLIVIIHLEVVYCAARSTKNCFVDVLNINVSGTFVDNKVPFFESHFQFFKKLLLKLLL